MMEYEVLPSKYWKAQDYLLYAYDVIADMIRQADKKKLSSVKFDMKDDEIQSFKNCEDIYAWLDSNGRHDIALRSFQGHTFFSLLRDFCYYIYESISCAGRGKVTVAYSLLRKPIRDNLLYLEWILAYPEEAYQGILFGDIMSCDVSNKKYFDEDRIKKIIDNASQKSCMGGSLNQNGWLYTVRFNSKEKISLQRIWNQTTHIVTKNYNYPTKRGNLNFIFADSKIWDDYWNYYYLIVPHLMAYALEICESLFLLLVTIDDFQLTLNRLVRFNKFVNLPCNQTVKQNFPEMIDNLIEILTQNNITPCFQCENCDDNIPITASSISEMIDNYYTICPKCKARFNICKYYTDIEYEKPDDTENP